jgi:hypothetical protein
MGKTVSLEDIVPAHEKSKTKVPILHISIAYILGNSTPFFGKCSDPTEANARFNTLMYTLRA